MCVRKWIFKDPARCGSSLNLKLWGCTVPCIGSRLREVGRNDATAGICVHPLFHLGRIRTLVSHAYVLENPPSLPNLPNGLGDARLISGLRFDSNQQYY